MKITSLLENTTERSDMRVEHGLSLYIETDSHKILFDMGQTDCFFENAAVLGINLADVDIAVLSHGHYDHGGGLKKFLEINRHAPVYIHKDAFLPHYNGTEKYIGLDIALKNSPCIVFTSGNHRIDDNLTILSGNGKKRIYPPVPSGLTEKTDTGFIPDDFRHEQYLMLEENGKKVLLSGCSHRGILDIAGWFTPDVLIGGFHYSKLPMNAELTEKAVLLAGFPTVFYTCHCTGPEQYEWMRRYMPKLHYLSCGQSILL